MLSLGKQSFQSFQLEIHTYLFYDSLKEKKRKRKILFVDQKKWNKDAV